MKLTKVLILVAVVGLLTAGVAGAADYTCKAIKAPEPVTVDAQLTEWGGAELSVISSDSIGWANAFLMWDEDYLYFAAYVEDEVKANSHSGGNIWQGDSVQISIDAENDKHSWYDGNDYEYGFAATDAGLAGYTWHKASGVSPSFEEIKMAIDTSGTVTVYEVAIPAKYVAPMKLAAGTVFGFDWLVNDDDGSGRQFMELTPGIGAKKDPSEYINVELAD